MLRITEAHDYDLIGTLLASTEAQSADIAGTFSNRPGFRDPESDSGSMKHEVPDLQKAGETEGSRGAILQRTLP